MLTWRLFVNFQAIQAKDIEIQELEIDRTKITAKALKYKEQNETLQSAIKEHVQAGEELQHKLKIETKMNAGKILSHSLKVPLYILSLISYPFPVLLRYPCVCLKGSK